MKNTYKWKQNVHKQFYRPKIIVKQWNLTFLMTWQGSVTIDRNSEAQETPSTLDEKPLSVVPEPAKLVWEFWQHISTSELSRNSSYDRLLLSWSVNLFVQSTREKSETAISRTCKKCFFIKILATMLKTTISSWNLHLHWSTSLRIGSVCTFL